MKRTVLMTVLVKTVKPTFNKTQSCKYIWDIY